jgi:importin subunit alpha-6/7
LNVEQPANDSLLGNTTWTISNLCRGKPHPKLELVKDAIPALVSIVMNSTKNSIIIDALWAISYISDGEDERIDAILKTNNGIAARLVQLVSSGDSALMAPAVRILGNFASGNEEQTQSVIDAGLLNIALNVLNSGKKNLRKEMCWLLSNIAAGTPKQIASLMNTKHLSETLITLAVDADWDSRKEAIWAVSNTITGGSDHIVSIVVNQNGIEAMVSVLNVPGETKMILVALDTIQHILTIGEKNNYRYDVTFDECGGIEKLEELQSHSDQAVYEKVVELIEKFFGEEENGEDENLAPAYDDNEFSFGIASPPPAKVLFESPKPIATTSFGAINNHQFTFGR